MRRLLIGFALGVILTSLAITGYSYLTPTYCLPVADFTTQVIWYSVTQGWIIDRSYNLNDRSWICLRKPLIPQAVTVTVQPH